MDLVAASDRGQIMHSVRMEGESLVKNHLIIMTSFHFLKLSVALVFLLFKYDYNSSTWLTTVLIVDCRLFSMHYLNMACYV